MAVAIMSAMHEENASIVKAMIIGKKEQFGNRTFYTGSLQGRDVVVVFSHWGKVAASITATSLISRYGVTEIIFTGVAGSLDDDLKIGDIVVAENTYQHDMDASPIIERHEIPLLGKSAISTNSVRRKELVEAATAFLKNDLHEYVSDDAIAEFALTKPRVVTADVASGDQFISDPLKARDIKNRLPGVACVEMEGASVAQVCESFAIPFGLVRTISDGANSTSEIDFQAFVNQVAQVYSLGIIKRYLRNKRIYGEVLTQ